MGNSSLVCFSEVHGKAQKKECGQMSMIRILVSIVLASCIILTPVSAGAETQGTGENLARIHRVSKIRVSRKKLAVDVGLYIKGAPGGKLSKAQIKKQLKAVKKFANTVRFYGVAGELTKAYKIARRMKFKVIGTAWLSGSPEADKKELKALIGLCRKKYVDVACVGSETLYRGDLTSKKLVSYLKYVRKKVSKKIPVTTAEDAGVMAAHPEVGRICDLLMVNAYPYWGGVTVSDAAEAFAGTINEVRDAYPGKELIVSETGWPTEGGSNKEAAAGGSQARRYFEDIRRWSIANNIVVLWFDAADEPWKASGEGKAGAHWGLMTKKCRLKFCYKGAVPF